MGYQKYKYKEYDSIYPRLYGQERTKLSKILPEDVKIEHVGSTSVPGLGGKGIIDIAVYTPKERIDDYMRILKGQGYEYSPHPGDASDKFMQKIIKYGGKERRVHVHLTLDPKFWESFLNVRDYLREHTDAREEYAKIKQEGSNHAAGDGNKYGNYKVEFVRNLAIKANEDARQKGKKHRLETIVAGSLALILFLSGGFLFAGNVTGKVVSGGVNSSLNWIAGSLFLIGLVSGFIWLKRKNKR